MPFLRGRDIKVFITTEDTGAGVILTGSAAAATTASVGINMTGASKGVGKLGSVTSSNNQNDRVPFVEGIDCTMGWEDENGNFFGTQKEYIIPYRKKWEVTITTKAQDRALSVLASTARHGVSNTTTLHDGASEFLSNTGYRVYIHDGSRWDVFYHGQIPGDGFSVTRDSSKAEVHALKLVGNMWRSNLPDSAISTTEPQE